MANQEMFQRVHAMLTEFPMLHRQKFWEEDDTALNGSCGTTRCVAGWAVWLKALDMGLVSRKREAVRNDLLLDVADHVGADTEDEYGDRIDRDDLYKDVGGALLGLDAVDAEHLFMDMVDGRVTRRVKSYAETGEDISDEEWDELS